MSDIKLTFVVLRTVLFVVFLISGYFLSKSKTNKQYWKIAIFPILTFAIISGLRFGRDIDYNVYYFRYISKAISGEYEYLFSVFIEIFNGLGIPYYGFVLFCSTFLIISFLYLLSKFKKAAFFILPLFLGIMGIENLIRWYLAFSFVIIAIGLLIEKRYIIALFLATTSYFVHEGMIMIVFIVVMFYIFANTKIIFKPIPSVMLFAVTVFLSSVDQLVSMVSVLDNFQFSGISDKGFYYLGKANEIASGEMSTGINEKGLLAKIRILICYAFPLYFGGKYFKESNDFSHIKWIYNLSAFSIIIMPLFILVEIFNRVSAVLICITIFFVGVTFFYAYKQRFMNKIRFYFLLISFLFLVYPPLKKTFNMDDNYEQHRMLFIWDANGREYLPLELF